jgi:CRP/FNR family cyclic AMP-dependent transcriptional regulator
MLGRDEKVGLLRTVPLFSTCSMRELRSIAAIADELSFREGTVLCRQGHPGRELFILVEGTVTVERNGAEVNRLGAGDFVGEGALVLSKPRNATITATSPIRALILTGTNFKRLLHDDPAISMKVLETLSERTPPDEQD